MSDGDRSQEAERRSCDQVAESSTAYPLLPPEKPEKT
jgi:hypothetical protein